MKRLAQYSLIILISANCFSDLIAQDITWASEVIFQYNGFKEAGPWSGQMILNEPDAYPYGSLNEKAFRLKDDNAYGTITVGFKSTTVAKELLVAENFAPGRVSKVVVFDPAGTEYVVYEKASQDIGVFSRLLSISLDGIDFVINKATIHLNTIGEARGWSQIDAVGLSSVSLTNEQKQAITKSNETIIEEDLTFSAERERLDESINTPYREIKPIISPDGKSLYFARQDDPQNIGGKRDQQDIYFSDFVNGKWRLAQNIGGPLNDKEPNGVCSISPDGNTMVVINFYKEDGSVEGKGASISYRTGSGWTQPIGIAIDQFVNKNQYQDFYLSNSAKYLVMAIESKETFGDQDLYVSFRNDDGTYSAPKNLGSTLNTSSVEYSPFLASDNRTLYFSSDGHGGEGGSDIFFARRLDESWTKWTTPQNIGSEINTKEWDAYYTVTARGDYAYFVSTSGEGGDDTKGDIYRISLKKDIKPDPVVLITGRVLDKKTNLPIEAEINYESLNNRNEDGIAKSNPEDGAYKIVLPVGNLYGFLAKSKGYISVFENEDFSDVTEYKEMTKDLFLVPIEVGQIVQLNNLFFVQSKSDILPESEKELDRLYALLVENPDMEIELKGHTDNQGYFKANMELSEKRAEAVMNYLMDRGISKKRISSKGYGPTQPLYPNTSLEMRAKNRRVEVEILKL